MFLWKPLDIWVNPPHSDRFGQISANDFGVKSTQKSEPSGPRSPLHPPISWVPPVRSCRDQLCGDMLRPWHPFSAAVADALWGCVPSPWPNGARNPEGRTPNFTPKAPWFFGMIGMEPFLCPCSCAILPWLCHCGCSTFCRFVQLFPSIDNPSAVESLWKSPPCWQETNGPLLQ